MKKIIFNNQNSPFYESVKADVQTYFKEKLKPSTGDFRLYSKTIILLLSFVGIYTWLIFFTPGIFIAIGLCIAFGLIESSIGFNIMHDACHGSYSKRKWVNELFGYSMNMLGSDAFIWKIKHNIIHHTYTNIDGVDDDIAKAPFIRHCETQPKYKLHKFQHIYLLPMYALATVTWVFISDFRKYFTHKIYTTEMRRMDVKEHFIFWLTKAFYVLVYMLIPVLMVGWVKFLIGFFIYHAAMGISLTIVFQLAHAVDKAEFVNGKQEGTLKIEEEWAAHQVKTTANFAMNNRIVSWFVGGLNFQIEHHLFPRISHIHYPAISKIVKRNCEKFGLPYNYHRTMISAIISHFRWMKQLGQ